MKQNNIDELKSQLEQIQATLSALGADKKAEADAPADEAPAPDKTVEPVSGQEELDDPAESAEADTKAVDPDVADDSDAAGDSGADAEDTDEAEPEAQASPVSGWRRFVPRTLRARVIVAAVLVLALAGGFLTYILTREDTLPGNVALRVLGHDVTIDELNSELQTLNALYGIEAPTDAKKLDTFRRDVAKAIAVSRILDKAAADRKIVIADKSARDMLTRYITQQFGNGGDAYDTFVKALGSVGTSEGQVLSEVKRQLALSRLYNTITENVTVSDAQVRAAFDKDRKALDTPELRDLRNIVVSTKQQAQDIVSKLAAGQPFASLAKSYSLDTSTNGKGGSLGNVAAADLDAAYAKAAFAAAKGAVFGPVQTEHGWNVGQVVSITAPAPAVYEKVKSSLRDQLLVKGQLDVWRAWIAKQIKSAHVKYASKYRPADPDAAPTSQPGGVPVGTAGSGSASTAPKK